MKVIFTFDMKRLCEFENDNPSLFLVKYNIVIFRTIISIDPFTHLIRIMGFIHHSWIEMLWLSYLSTLISKSNYKIDIYPDASSW